MTEPQVHEMATEYEYSCLPDEHPDRLSFTVCVRYRGAGHWAVMRSGGRCLGRDGEWAWETGTSIRDDDWLATHRFDLPTAQRLAREAAPRLSVNGWTLDRILARDAKEADQ